MNTKSTLFPFIFTILLLITCSISEAQTCPPDCSAFKGVVFDAETGHPIKDARVVLMGIGEGSNYTNEKGEYFVSNVYQKESMVGVQAKGYLTYKQTVLDLKGGETKTLCIALYNESSFNPNATGAFTISGTIFDEDTMAPLGNSDVIAQVYNFDETLHHLERVKTDSNGNYEISLKPGFYIITYYKQHPQNDYQYTNYIFSRYFENGEHFKQDTYLKAVLAIAGGSEADDGTTGDNGTGDTGQETIPGFRIFEVVILITLTIAAISRKRK
jgi:hypothetical protein